MDARAKTISTRYVLQTTDVAEPTRWDWCDKTLYNEARDARRALRYYRNLHKVWHPQRKARILIHIEKVITR